MLESISFLQILLLTVSVSLILFTTILVCLLLSVFNGSGFIAPSMTVSGAAMIGAGFGITHGLLFGLFLIWKRSDSIFNLLAGSVLTAEVISLLIVIILLVRHAKDYISFSARMGFTNYLSALVNIIATFLFISVILLVSAIVIALVNRFILFYFVR